MLIGDPKQAIYAFRGADVYAYLDANKVVESESTLDVNWRSDQGLIDAYDALFAGAQLGYADIAYRTDARRDAHQDSRLVGAPEPAPLRVRMVHAGDGLVPLTARKAQPKMPDTRALIAAGPGGRRGADARGRGRRSSPGAGRHRDRARPRCIPATSPCWSGPTRTPPWCATRSQAVGVPAVIGGSGSVFATAPAHEWLRLLEALERPTARDRAVARRPDAFVGWTAEEVATASEEEWEDLHWSLHQWAALLRDQGVAALFETVSSARDVPRRVLERPSGERFLTDLRHIGQLLHEAGVPRAWVRPRWPPGCDGASTMRRATPRTRNEPATRVRRRGRPGAHHPPQQGPGVPDRLLPGDLGRPRQHVGGPRLPRPEPGQPADHRRRPTRATTSTSTRSSSSRRDGARTFACSTSR